MMAGKLTARRVATAPEGKHADGGGLYLFVDAKGARTWQFLFSWQGRRPQMALGSARDLALADARDAAQAARKLVRAGVNPIDARREERASASGRPTFGECADALIASKESEWRNDKHRAQWRMTLAEYAAPLRSKPVDEIDTADVLAVLKPLWQEKPETASRLRGRIEAVLDAAKAQGHRTGENPAAWRGHLAHLLPRRGKLTRGHHAAMPYRDVAAFIGRLRQRDGLAALALEFCILTATRSGEALGARWAEIDIAGKVWTVPATRMKAGKEHRVPLSARSLEILESLNAVRLGEYVFPSARAERPLSGMALAMVLRRMGSSGVTVHGFRSAFRDWAGNETHFPSDLAEQALAHRVGDETERAYRRSDALEKRRALMEAWAVHVEPKAPGVADVLPFKKSGGEAA